VHEREANHEMLTMVKALEINMRFDKTSFSSASLTAYRSGPLKLQLFLSLSPDEWRGKTSNFMRPEQ
jgi:hypothetical protein